MQRGKNVVFTRHEAKGVSHLFVLRYRDQSREQIPGLNAPRYEITDLGRSSCEDTPTGVRVGCCGQRRTGKSVRVDQLLSRSVRQEEIAFHRDSGSRSGFREALEIALAHGSCTRQHPQILDVSVQFQVNGRTQCLSSDGQVPQCGFPLCGDICKQQLGADNEERHD